LFGEITDDIYLPLLHRTAEIRVGLIQKSG